MSRLYTAKPTDPADIANLSLEYQKDILATHYLAPLSSNYLPWTEFSMRPCALVQVLNDILVRHRSTIVECGGGISTFYIARLLKTIGGHLYTLEHNEEWLNFVQKGLEREGLTDRVTLIHAPLKPTDLALENIPWYDTKAIAQQLSQEQKIDLLLVDGPPAYQENIQYSRYPAVPYFLPSLSNDCTIVIDDINRHGEQEIVKRWEKLLNLDFEIKDGDIGMVTINQ